jgi:hypothetical protein
MTDSHIYCFLVFRAGGCPFYSLSRSHPSEIYVLQISDLPLPCFSCPSFSWSEILGRLSFQKIWNFRPDYPDSLDADTPFSFSENLGVKNTRALQGPLRESHAIHCIFPPFFPKKWPSLDRKNGVQLCWITQFIASIFRHIPNQSNFFLNLDLMSSKLYCIPCIPIIVHKFLCNPRYSPCRLLSLQPSRWRPFWSIRLSWRLGNDQSTTNLWSPTSFHMCSPFECWNVPCWW